MLEPLAIIVALGRDGAIGRNNNLLWHLPGDLPRFKTLTKGHPVVMGRKTWLSLPHRPLPGRPNIVITRNPDFNDAGATRAQSPQEALEICRRIAPGIMPFVIGGGEIYRNMLPLATHLYLTRVDADTPDADTWLPRDIRQGFHLVASTPGSAADAHTPPFSFDDYIRDDQS